jgi:hypothetical protein
MASGLVPNTTKNFLRWLDDLVIFMRMLQARLHNG